jgi:hypothetical protein
VLVEGPSTPNLRRQPRTSLIAAPEVVVADILLRFPSDGKHACNGE